MKIADELADDPLTPWHEVGLTLLEAAPYEPHDGRSRWWRVEDRNAGPEYTGHKVDIVATRHHDGLDYWFELSRTILDA